MKKLRVVDVRALPGDSGFLLDDGQTAVLCDSGFGFTAKTVGDKINEVLGGRSLDYILLTHSHYDHVLGSAWLTKIYPDVQIVAGAYAAQVFKRPSALATMEELDRRVAERYGVTPQEGLAKELRVDIAVNDADIVTCGNLHFRVIGLPGHTQCSVGYYLEEARLLLGTETLGVYFGENIYLPSCLVGYQMTLDAYRKVKELDIAKTLLPHWGVVGKKETDEYLQKEEAVTRQTAGMIQAQRRMGKTKAEILTCLEEILYKPCVASTYPPDAFRLNTSIMIDLIEKESS